MPRHPPKRSAALLISFSLLASGCEPEGPGLEFRLRVASQPLYFSLGGEPAPTGIPPADIDAFRLCVQDAWGQALVCQDYHDLSQPTFFLNGVRAGSHRQVTFQGYALSDGKPPDVRWCGRAVEVEIKKNTVTPVRLTLYRCGDFTAGASPLTSPRAFHSASLLPDGRVLLVGGFSSLSKSDTDCSVPCAVLAATGSVEVFDPQEGTFRQLLQLAHPRGLHAARTLSDGRVLVAGGCEKATLQATFLDAEKPGAPLGCISPGFAASTAEIIDPLSATSVAFDIPHSTFSAALELADDRLLLIGGQETDGSAHRRVFELKPAGSSLEARELGSTLTIPRAAALALSLNASGKWPLEVLVLGGAPAVSRTNPGTFAEILLLAEGGAQTRLPRFVEQASGLGFPAVFSLGLMAEPGLAVVAGGVFPARYLSEESPFLPQPLRKAATIDLTAEHLEMLDAEHLLGRARLFGSLTPLSLFGNALLAGGFEHLQPALPALLEPSATVEFWDAGWGGFSLVWARGAPVEMLKPRAAHAALRLRDGAIMISGGTDGYAILEDSEFFSPYATTLQEGGLR